MKRLLTLVFAAFLTAGLAAAQAGSTQNPPQPAPPAGHDHAAHHPHAGHPMEGMKDHEHAMGRMQAGLDSMKVTLQKMKDSLAGIKDQPTRDQMQLNINLWQSLLDNMGDHMKMMEGTHHDMDMGDMHHGHGMDDMHHGAGMGMGMHHGDGMPCCKDGMPCAMDKDGKGMACGDGKTMPCADGKDMKCCGDGTPCGKGKTDTKSPDDKK